MKKTLLAGIAALFLATGASAQEGTPPPLGWVYSKYVDCPDGHPGHGCYIVRTDNTVNVRQHPNGPILSSLGKGARVIPLDWNGSWVLVTVRIYQRNQENAQQPPSTQPPPKPEDYRVFGVPNLLPKVIELPDTRPGSALPPIKPEDLK
jgi:hypothetical protein